MKFTVLENGNVIMDYNSAQALKVYVTAHQAATRRWGIEKEIADTYLGIDLREYANESAEDMDPIKFLEALKRCVKKNFNMDL